MALNTHELMDVYNDLIKAYPEDLRIARPLIQMMQSRGENEPARDLAMSMARRMLALGYSSYALAFLSIGEQLGYPDADEIDSMKTMAELTLGSPPQALSEAGSVFELIEALSDSESQEFLKQGTLLRTKVGEKIVKQGEVSRKFYLILEGTIHIYVDTKQGEHIEFGELKQGDFFGEVACIYQLPRTATVESFTDAVLLEFSDSTVTEMIHVSPIAGDSLMKVVQRRMMETISFMHPAFSQLGLEDRVWLEDDSALVEFLPGEELVEKNEGDDAYFYVVVFGKVIAKRADEFKCGLGVNAMFGDASAMLKFPEGTTLYAAERSIACKMPIQIFEAFYKTYSGFEYWVNKYVQKRNEKLNPPT
ncbi:MAG: cyclic nucleotide-binding domain-containing protein [Ghiorsea sp.]